MNTDIPKELFRLNKVTDNPIFEGFALFYAPSLLGRADVLEDMMPGFNEDKQGRFVQDRLSAVWKPVKVDGRVAPFNDYPCVNMSYPVFSRRACEALRDFLQPNGELLPLETNVGEYFFCNITTVSDALDVPHSICHFISKTRRIAMGIEYFSFHRERLAGLSIFRIYEWPMEVIVTEKFVKRVQEHGLNGFCFTKIWPFEKGVQWDDLPPVACAEVVNKAELKQNTLVIILPLKDKKPDKDEKRIIKRLGDELDAQLVITSLDSPYFGSYEGDDTVNQEFRMFLSCPDVDALVAKLDPWLRRLNWHSRITVMKRYGNLHDVDAQETSFSYPR